MICKFPKPSNKPSKASYQLIYSAAIYFFKKLLPLAWVFSASNLYAHPAQNLFIGNAKAISLGNAVTADPPGIDSIHFNPAGLALLDGRQYQAKLIFGQADVSADFTPSPSFQENLTNQGFTDEASNNSSKMESVGIYFAGEIIEVPFIATPPIGGISISPKDSRFTFGTAIYAPLVAGLLREDDDPGRFAYSEVGVTRLTYFSPTAALQVSPEVSIGISLGFSYMGVGANTDLRFPNTILGDIESVRQSICTVLGVDGGFCLGSLDPTNALASIELSIEDQFSPSFNIGLLWEPTEWLRWGFTYRSPAKNTLKGKLKISYAPEVQEFVGEAVNAAGPVLLSLAGFGDFQYEEQEVGATLELDYPQHFATGVSIQVLPDWKVNFDLKWTDTGVWDTWLIEFDESVDVLSLLGSTLPVIGERNISGSALSVPRGYNSTWNWAIGIEHQFNSRLALRAGYEPQTSQIPDDRLGFVVPVEEVKVMSLGFSYQWKKSRLIEGALSYVNSDFFIPVNSSSNFNNEEFANFVYNPYTGNAGDIELNVYLLMLSYSAYW